MYHRLAGAQEDTEKRTALTHQTAEQREGLGYFAILRRWLWLILLLVAITMGVIYFRGSTAPPVYLASETLQVIAQEPDEVALFTPLYGTGTQERIRAVRDVFVSILQSSNIARRTIAELDLNTSAQRLLDDISVQREGEFITVMGQAVGPQAAESLVATHVEQALDYYRQVRSRPVEITEQFISDRLATSRQGMAAAEDAFLKFKLQYNMDSLHREISGVQDTIRAFGQELDKTRVEIERFDTLASQMQDGASEALMLADEANAEAQILRAALDVLEETDAAAEAADAVEATEGIEQTTAKLQEAADRADHYRGVARTFETSAVNDAAAAEAARAAEAEYSQIISVREAELAALIGLSADYDALENDLQQAQKRVSFLADKANEAETKKAQALSAGYLQIIEPAHTPGTPMPSTTLQIMALGAVVSLIVGTLLAFLLEILTGRQRRDQRPSET